ncbi:MAG: GLPGLI family protein [Flavobacteriaceae bacterium]|nr:GLPGLI family protein [Flavobacteriaceae bacterium]
MITLYLIICFSLLSYSQQNGKAYYKKKSSHNFKPIEKSDSRAGSLYKSVNSSISDMEFILTFNKSLALFEDIKKLDIDENSSAAQFNKVFSGYKGPYYFNFEINNVIRKQGKYLIEKKLSDYNWILTKEKMIINNLTCHKATTIVKQQGRSGELLKPAVAWYSPDINLSAGPDGFGGLPGLIIQLEFDRVVTTLQKVEFLDKPISIELPNKGKKMTEAEFEALMKDLVENRDKYYKN